MKTKMPNAPTPDTAAPLKQKKGLVGLICLLLALVVLFGSSAAYLWSRHREESPQEGIDVPDWISVHLIEIDGASRRGEKLEAVRDIAVHYVANPGTSAMANRNYFNNPDSTTSSHFIVGLEGEIILCVPLDEKSSATNERNRDTISVEVCHPDATGRFSDVTYRSLVRLLAYLLDEYSLTEENLIRHYDVTGKLCPLYYVENPDAWEDLKGQVESYRLGKTQ